MSLCRAVLYSQGKLFAYRLVYYVLAIVLNVNHGLRYLIGHDQRWTGGEMARQTLPGVEIRSVGGARN